MRRKSAAAPASRAWSPQPVLDGKILELAPEPRSPAIVDREHHEPLRGEVLLGEVQTLLVGVRPASVDLDESRTTRSLGKLRRVVEETLDPESIEAGIGDLPGRLDGPPDGGERGQPLRDPADEVQGVRFPSPRRRRVDEGEAPGARGVANAGNRPLHVRDARGHASRGGHRPHVGRAPFQVGEVDEFPVRRPRRGVPHRRIGGVDLHVHDPLRRPGGGVRVRDHVDVGEVLVQYSPLAVPNTAIRSPSGDQTGVDIAISVRVSCRWSPVSTSTIQRSSCQ